MAGILAFLILFAASACAQQGPPPRTPSGVHRTTPQAPLAAGASRQQAPAASPVPQMLEWQYPDATTKWGIYDPNTGIMKPDASPQMLEWQYPDGTTKWGIYDPNTGIMR